MLKHRGILAVVALVAAHCIAFSFAGQFQQSVRLNHPLASTHEPASSGATLRALPDTVRILAVMVEFPADSDPLTTGNGRFDISAPTTQIFDPPPHDRQYFLNHLSFLGNYWRKVSNGQIILSADLVDTIIQLSQTLRTYSPSTSSQTNLELAQLIDETWRKVDQERPALDFTRYHSFCIFHAGVGRDIDMESLLGYDPTPYDIPSLTMNIEALRRAMGSSYRGVPVEDSTFFVTNSMILPETESRPVSSGGSQVLLELGMNGLLAASFGSYLGLPDLFDTRTGASGIGRFGLMDGQSIFSWNGVFPPEPSAWEKIFLDRTHGLRIVDIIDAPVGERNHLLPAVGRSSVVPDTAVRVLISPREYFLIENRNRDGRADGATVWLANGTSVVQNNFMRDTSGFNAFDQRSLGGVVIDVDEFDWSLPGGVSNSGEFFDGGALIWHVDENVIETALSSNAVNANPNRRGVDLEEADGSQDIGQSYGFISPGAGSEAGTALDFWFSGNSSPVFRNLFSLSSHPNSVTNAGANSHITLRDFTSRSPVLSFRSVLGDSLATPVSGYPRLVGTVRADASPQLSRALFIAKGDTIFAFRSDTAATATTNPSGYFSASGGQFPPAVLPATSDTLIVSGVQDSTIFIWRAVDTDRNGVFESVTEIRFNHTRRLTTPVALGRRTVLGNSIDVACAGDANGQIVIVACDTSFSAQVSLGSSPILSFALYGRGASADSIVAVVGTEVRTETGLAGSLPFGSSGWQVLAVDDRFVAADVGGSDIILFDGGLNITHRRSSSAPLQSIAIADLDSDGRREILFAGGRTLSAINLSNAVADNFPIVLPSTISGGPVVSKLPAIGVGAQVFVATADGRFWGFDSRGKQLAGFPLILGSRNLGTPSISVVSRGGASYPLLSAIDSLGYLYSFQLSAETGTPEIPWGSFMGGTLHLNSATSPLSIRPLASEFMPANRAYNWPNPVYEGKTFIRYYLSADSDVRIKILDFDGQIVDELSGPGRGGFDNEVEWDASKVQSGVYLGHIEAQSGGQDGVAIIKIAVVR